MTVSPTASPALCVASHASRASFVSPAVDACLSPRGGHVLLWFALAMAFPIHGLLALAMFYDDCYCHSYFVSIHEPIPVGAIEVSRRQIKVRESAAGGDYISKLEAAEAKLQELKSNMVVLGKEAVAAMTAVEAQQQRLTLQRLIAMVESEHTYHQKILQILEQLEAEMLSERQRIEASPSPAAENYMPPPPSYEEVNDIFVDSTTDVSTENVQFFLAEVIQSYLAETEVELNLSVGDYVVVRTEQTVLCNRKRQTSKLADGLLMTEQRQEKDWGPYKLKASDELKKQMMRISKEMVNDVISKANKPLSKGEISNNGWAEGECKGKAGWFPFAYMERRERVLASKVVPNL
ncbi:hypothetical protein ZIOFF_011659 [Zingiber officinale]|uniref:Uncharacterized protein n=1 Tax=Zingiber officinale TaxID=94328 RepID=A0A8J5I671_ZINOF|nr:hypothetical protein ZIOFF_011659 [Zingiber officinale]